MSEDPDLPTSIRTGAEWIAAAISELAGAMPSPWRGEGLAGIAEALNRIGAGMERQAAALERLAAVQEKRK